MRLTPRTLPAALAMLGLILIALPLACAPAYQLDVVGTSWSLAAIDGQRLDAPDARLEFLPDGDNANLTLGCASVLMGYWLDSDGDGLKFFVDDTPACAGNGTDQEQAILRAIEGVRSWSVTDDQRIELHGENEIALERVPQTGGG